MDYKEVIDNIYNEVKPLFGQGKVADYIPALANINPRQYGIAIATLDGQIVGTGDYQTKFSIESLYSRHGRSPYGGRPVEIRGPGTFWNPV